MRDAYLELIVHRSSFIAGRFSIRPEGTRFSVLSSCEEQTVLTNEQRHQLIEKIRIFPAQLRARVEGFLEALRPYAVVELARSGPVAMSKEVQE